MTSVLNVDTIADKAGTGPVGLTKQSAAKAWLNADGTGTISTRDSFNVSGIVDSGTGIVQFNMTNSFANVGYSATASTNNFHNYVTNGDKTVSSNKVAAANGSHVNTDSAQMNCTCHGDLA